VNGTTTYFYYSDEGLTTEADSTGKITQSYGYAPDSTWGTDPLYMSINDAYHFYLNDHLGTPQLLATTTGNQSWAAIYEAFGKAATTVSSVTSYLRFPGQYEDENTGYHYNLHRTYDNATGRYTKVDPIGLVGGVNLFGYAAVGNPISHIDPEGLRVGKYPFPVPIGGPGDEIGGIPVGSPPDLGDWNWGLSYCKSNMVICLAILNSLSNSIGSINDDSCEDENKCEKAKSDARRIYLHLTNKRFPGYFGGGVNGPDEKHRGAIIQKQVALKKALKRVLLYCAPLPPEYPEWERIANMPIPILY